MDLEAGEIYYLRLQLQEGVSLHGGHIVIALKEESLYDVKHMKPITLKDIKEPNTCLERQSVAELESPGEVKRSR